MLHHCFTQPTKWTKKTNGPADMWASRLKPKKALDLHPTADILLQSLVLPPALPGPPAPAFGVQRHCFAHLSETLPHRWQGHPSTPHLLLFSTECRPTPHPNQSSFPLLSIYDSTATSSPSPGHSSLGPRRHPPPRCARRGVVNIRESSEEDCTWRA